MNLRPNNEEATVVKEVRSAEARNLDGYVKTSVSLSRAVAVKAKAYAQQQQLRHARGERKDHYSFSQFFNEALQQYLETLEKGEGHEDHR